MVRTAFREQFSANFVANFWCNVLREYSTSSGRVVQQFVARSVREVPDSSVAAEIGFRGAGDAF